jgi:hypothetical protein
LVFNLNSENRLSLGTSTAEFDQRFSNVRHRDAVP